MREDIISFSPGKEGSSVFHLEMAGISYCDGSYRICRRGSHITVFEYVIEGRGTLIHDGDRCCPEKGDVYIVHAGSDHTYFSSAESPWTKIWFNVGGILVERLLEAYGLADVFHIKGCNTRRLFDAGVAAARKRPADIHEKTALAIHGIIQKISIELRRRQDSGHTPEGLKLKEHIDANFAEIRGLEALSKLVGRSPSQTIRIFRNEWGRTPYDYTIERRLSAAKSMLLSTNLTVKEISARTGFADQFHFSNIFKRRLGLAPENFRRAQAQ